jgi:receptor expression-enhancing protein 5/6
VIFVPQIVEGVADVLISMIPFYFLGKMGFLVWCYSPSTKGAKVVYETVIKPFIVPALGLDGGKNKGE